MSAKGELDEEIESWKGFPWALRKAELEAWNRMIREMREQFGDAVEKSGRTFTTDPFFMALLLAQQKMIKGLLAELKARGVDTAGAPAANSTLDA
ncbi:MAG: hypothetical protein KGI38_09965 [Thaumarchaeota archaeon]|nr:hypothetical protein [Nitrososphaerota archaeon]